MEFDWIIFLFVSVCRCPAGKPLRRMPDLTLLDTCEKCVAARNTGIVPLLLEWCYTRMSFLLRTLNGVCVCHFECFVSFGCTATMAACVQPTNLQGSVAGCDKTKRSTSCVYILDKDTDAEIFSKKYVTCNACLNAKDAQGQRRGRWCATSKHFALECVRV